MLHGIQTEYRQNFLDIGFVDRVAVELDGKDDVFVHVEDGNQIVALEDKSNLAAAEDSERVVLERENVLDVYKRQLKLYRYSHTVLCKK